MITVVLLVCLAKALNTLLDTVFIVPKVDDVMQVPLLWWLGSAVPLAVVVIWLGSRLRSARDFVACSVTAGATAHLFNFGAAVLGFPTIGAIMAREAPKTFWVEGLVFQCVIWAAYIGVTWRGAVVLRSRGEPAK